MPTSTTDSVTGIIIPTPEQRSGPQYAQDISNALLTLAHLTHTGAANLDGYQIPAAGLDIDADVSFQSNNLTTLRSARFSSQGSPLGGVGDLNCFYVSGGEAWFNDSLGNQVQLTINGVVNSTADNNWSVNTTSSNYTINANDGYAVINYNSWSGNRILTLPAANGVPAGRFYFIKDKSGNANTSSNTIAITGSGSDTVDGSANYTIKIAYGAVLVMSDGTSNWQLFNFCRPDTLVGNTIGITALTGTATLASSAGVVALSAATDITLAASDDVVVTASDDISITATDAILLDGYSVTTAGQLYLPTKAVTSATYVVDTTTEDVVIFCDSTSNAIQISLPSPSNGRVLWIQDVGGNANTNNITLHRFDTGDQIQGIAADYVMDADYQGVKLIAYSGGSWFIIE